VVVVVILAAADVVVFVVAAVVISAVVSLVVLVAVAESCLRVGWSRDHATTTTTLVFVFARCFERKCHFYEVESLHVPANVAIFTKAENAKVISRYFFLLTSGPPPKRCEDAKIAKLRAG
jgi:hypothetical protein